MPAMPIATILGGVDVNNAHGYYHYSDRAKYTCGYNDLPLRCFCGFFSSARRVKQIKRLFLKESSGLNLATHGSSKMNSEASSTSIVKRPHVKIRNSKLASKT
jgi:hypothetical protein